MGTALAKICAEKGHQAQIWAMEPEVVAKSINRHTNETFLPGVRLPDSIYASNSLEEVVSGKSILLRPCPVMGCVAWLKKWLPL